MYVSLSYVVLLPSILQYVLTANAAPVNIAIAPAKISAIRFGRAVVFLIFHLMNLRLMLLL
jgi:hypothetical protein